MPSTNKTQSPTGEEKEGINPEHRCLAWDSSRGFGSLVRGVLSKLEREKKVGRIEERRRKHNGETGGQSDRSSSIRLEAEDNHGERSSGGTRFSGSAQRLMARGGEREAAVDMGESKSWVRMVILGPQYGRREDEFGSFEGRDGQSSARRGTSGRSRG